MNNFFTGLVNDAETVLSVFSKLQQTKTAQTIEAVSADVVLAVELKQTSFSVDGYTISATLNGAPAAFDLGAAFAGIAAVKAGSPSTFTSGALTVTVTPPNGLAQVHAA